MRWWKTNESRVLNLIYVLFCLPVTYGRLLILKATENQYYMYTFSQILFKFWYCYCCQKMYMHDKYISELINFRCKASLTQKQKPHIKMIFSWHNLLVKFRITMSIKCRLMIYFLLMSKLKILNELAICVANKIYIILSPSWLLLFLYVRIQCWQTAQLSLHPRCLCSNWDFLFLSNIGAFLLHFIISNL